MWKAGLIGAAVGFVLAIIAAVVFPLACNPCAALLIGLAAGALAGVFEKPFTSGSSAGEGAKAGAIATAGNLLGQMVGAVINVLVVGPATGAEIARQLGLPASASFSSEYYLGAFGGNCLCGLLGVALGAGLGALGGMLWFQISGKNQFGGSPSEDIF
jgi:hypothetical protein